MYKISDHFTIEEACKSNIAIRKGIHNHLPVAYLNNATKLAENVLEPLREVFNTPIVPSSWYRSPELNTLIGGSKNSQHTKAAAVDFEINGVSNLEVAEYIKEYLTFDQLILEYFNEEDPNSGWLHVSYVTDKINRQQVLRYNGKRYLGGLTSEV